MGVNFINKYQNLVILKSGEKNHIKIEKFEVKIRSRKVAFKYLTK